MSYRGVVFDLDGTVYRSDELLPGVREAVETLRERDVELLFFSNNPTVSQAGYAERLRELGLPVRPEEVRSSGSVTTDYLAEHHADDAVFFVGSTGLREQLEARDLALTDEPAAADVVLASFDRGFDYDTMTDAMRALDRGVPFLGSDPDVTVPVGDGRKVPGSGAIINAVAGVAEREPDRILGKPSEEAVRAVREALDAPPGDCLMVGDRLNTDIELGERAGMTTVLVLTGVTDRSLLEDATPTPDHVVDSLAELPALVEAGPE